ncbi:MAG: tRNA pseudouridine(13) synthase TruD [Candidatus Omnitrophica bacterium]|nr:tRNA pseudouridine(13) synthase TruD [Candidatus Omnitrophota bacterium]
MKITIKSKPEDFIVEEEAILPIKNKGAFSVYQLTKKGWNTIDLLHRLSQELKIPYNSLSYGARKDRHALTTQYIAIKNYHKPEFKQKDFSLKLIGFMDRAMGPDLIKENKFKIAIRNLNANQIKNALNEIAIIQETGYPNYFDDQRFGSFDTNQGFFADKVLKGHFNGALKIHLTANNQFFLKHWKDWKTCLEHAKTKFEKDAFLFLLQDPNKFLPLLKLIPKDELTIYFSAFQSYLWNEVLSKIILQKTSAPFKAYKGIAGDYLFYTNLEKEAFEYLKSLELPAPSAKTKMPDKLSQHIYENILGENHLKAAMFNQKKLRKAFFKPTLRKAIISPTDLSFTTTDDELYHEKQKLKLCFTLAKGSFATMFLKRIFSS